MPNKYCLLFLLFSTVVFSQDLTRMKINGQIVSDSLEVEGITVKNAMTKKFVITDADGNFTLFAKERDSLVFSGVSFKSSVLILTKSHLEEELIKVRLSVKINVLKEIVVSPYTLTGNLEVDTKRLKVETAHIDLGNMDFTKLGPEHAVTESALRSVTPGSGNDFNGVDFIKLSKLVGKLFRKSKPKEKKIEFITDKIFSEAVKEKFSQQFFTSTLQLQLEQIDLFLAYCDDASPKNRELLNPKKEFELIDFLIKKSEEYHKKNQ